MCEETTSKLKNVHKEEINARIASAKQDKLGLRKKLELFIDQLNLEGHPESVVSIASGCIAPLSVNVHDALAIGSQKMSEFEKSWHAGFHNTISKKVETISITKKHVNVLRDQCH